MIHVSAQAPTRVDLAGGTLDLWPIHHLLDEKATVNIGVTLQAHVEIQVLDQGPFQFLSQDQNLEISGDYQKVITSTSLPLFGLLLQRLWPKSSPTLRIMTRAESPAGAGLGGSSCLGIALAAALYRTRQLLEKTIDGEHSADLEETALVRLVQDAEARLIRSPTGCQDYWGAIRGRVNVIEYAFGETRVDSLDSGQIPGLGEQLILCYSGRSRASAINNWEIFKRLFDGDDSLLSVFQAIGQTSALCAQAIRRGDLEEALIQSAKEWALRTKLWPHIETEETKRIDFAAHQAGAKFSRVCGAGGGGVMAVFCEPSLTQGVAKAMEAAGGRVLPAKVANHGLAVTPLTPR